MEQDESDPCGSKKVMKAMSPGNLPLPSGGSWDSSGMVMSPFAPDMNSIASGSYMQGGPSSYGGPGSAGMSSTTSSLTRSSSFDFGGNDLLSGNSSSGGGGGGPLSQLAESVNSLVDPLSSMEKALNEQIGGMPAPPTRDSSGSGNGNGNNNGNGQSGNGGGGQPHTPQTGPHTPHTPLPHTPGGSGGQVHTPGGPPSVNNNNTCSGNGNNSSNDMGDTSSELPSDLNFDPEAVINGEGSGNESLNVSVERNSARESN
jgi:hypothetical protein